MPLSKSKHALSNYLDDLMRTEDDNVKTQNEALGKQEGRVTARQGTDTPTSISSEAFNTINKQSKRGVEITASDGLNAQSGAQPHQLNEPHCRERNAELGPESDRLNTRLTDRQAKTHANQLAFKTQDLKAEALEYTKKEKLQTLLNQQTLQQIVPEIQVEEPAPRSLNQDIQKTELKLDVPEPKSAVVQEVKPKVDNQFAVENTSEWAKNGRPKWAQNEFDALLFDVGGLTLAVPLISLGQIVSIDKDALTPLFGQSDWFMGMLPSNIGKLRVVNTALFVMPEKYDPRFVDEVEYAISIDGVAWALAVNKVNQPIRLNPDEIRWRTERSSRPWLAGTVTSAMCALLDIPNMALLLNQSDKQLRRRDECTPHQSSQNPLE